MKISRVVILVRDTLCCLFYNPTKYHFNITVAEFCSGNENDLKIWIMGDN